MLVVLGVFMWRVSRRNAPSFYAGLHNADTGGAPTLDEEAEAGVFDGVSGGMH